MSHKTASMFRGQTVWGKAFVSYLSTTHTYLCSRKVLKMNDLCGRQSNHLIFSSNGALRIIEFTGTCIVANKRLQLFDLCS